ncbi:MAG: oligosaccharide flippase family protein [bacterium]|nr:oligosaccharide flippase family protein [bacterium]
MTQSDVNNPAGSGSSSNSDLKVGVRGSGLFVVGRVLSVLVNFATQVLVVRYLTKADYGAFSWALSVVAMGSTLGLFGMQKAVSRFLPIYIERDQEPAQTGTILLALTATLGLGLTMAVAVFGVSGLLQQNLVSDPRSVTLLLILVLLIPIQGLDHIFHSLFAVLASPKAIFYRRYIATPLLRLGAVIGVFLAGASVSTLAWAYLLTGLAGVAVYGWVLIKLLRRIGYLGWDAFRKARAPLREILGFCLPQLTTDLIWILRSGGSIVILENFWGTESVAEFRAVMPVAGLCLVILESTRFLYPPLASKQFARGDHGAIHSAYSRFTGWITVMSFPAVATCLILATPITTALFGERYADAAILLQILVIGNAIDAVTGSNLMTLNVFAEVRFIAAVNTLMALASIGAYLVLIPAYGATGAALATASTIVVHSLINQVGLVSRTGVGRLSGGHAPVLLGALVGLVVLGGLAQVTRNPWVLAGAIVAVSILLLRSSRDYLAITETFPELARIPGAAWLFAPKKDPS